MNPAFPHKATCDASQPASQKCCFQAIVFCTVAMIMTTGISAQENPLPGAEPVIADPPTDAFPARVTLRFSERLFETPQHAEIDEVTRIDEQILGVRNVGTAHTTGNLAPDFKEKQDAVGMKLIFSGTTTSHTVARQGMAQIAGQTTTSFRVETPIEFDIERGFKASKPTATATIIGSCKQVRPRGAGLLGPIVKAKARKQMREQSSQIRRESEALTRRRMAEESDRRVEAQLEVWNQQWTRLQALLRNQPGYQAKSPINLSSEEGYLLLAIGAEAAANQAGEAASNADSQSGKSDSLLDVIIHNDDLQLVHATVVLKLVEKLVEQGVADELLKIDRVTFDTETGDGWVMLRVREAKPETKPRVVLSR